jgi:NAD-dependent SIR2 family protein deacetylase
MGSKMPQLHGKGALVKCPICGSRKLDPDTGDIQPNKELWRVTKCESCENYFAEAWRNCTWWFIVDDEKKEANP